ncbi:NACHT domain-containing protein [Streptomyces sp. NPDC007369]|uniref:NACHT domain-containing protein n=1 Tax=Streptomyces sp. NPDC007369 TaxID=3154589 RepID=UPI003404703D
MAVAVWAVIRFLSGRLTTSDQIAVFGLLIALLPAAGLAAKALKPSADVDLANASRKLAEAVKASEVALRTQLLGGDNQPIDVAFTFDAVPSRVAVGAAPTGRLSEIGDYYRRLQPRRLLITGAPGTGKTVLAIELILSLLEERQAGEPVPVRLSLAGWDTTRALDTWLADELADVYRVPRATAKYLADQGCVLPVLDGLDEMDTRIGDGGPSRAAAALAALNQSYVGRQRAPVVVTCRSTTYDALTAKIRLLDAARIDVSAVTVEQAQRFVAARALNPQQWQPVIDAARGNPHGPPAHVMSTPWLLTLAMTTYEAEGDPTEILHFSDREALRSHLLDRFVPAAVELHKRAGNRIYKAEEIDHWLGLLARYLTDNARAARTVHGHVLPSTDLVLHRLWPLAGTRARAVDIVITCVAGLAIMASFQPWAIRGIYAALPRAVVALLIIGWIFASARSAWPTPKNISLSRLRTLDGWRAVIGSVTFAFIAALAFSVAIILSIIFALGPEFFIVDTMVGYMIPLAPIALIGGIAFGLRRNLETTAFSKGPNYLVWADLRSGVVIGFSAGAASFMARYFVSWSIWIDEMFASAILFAVLGGIVWAGAWRRYFATLLCMRRRLPWRLGRFLAWASEAGLLRVAGNAYQFRHLELQDHLAEFAAARENDTRATTH